MHKLTEMITKHDFISTSFSEIDNIVTDYLKSRAKWLKKKRNYIDNSFTPFYKDVDQAFGIGEE